MKKKRSKSNVREVLASLNERMGRLERRIKKVFGSNESEVCEVATQRMKESPT